MAVSLVKSPVVCVLPSISVVEYWNSLSFEIAVIVNVPLNAELPTPVVFAELFTFKILILSFTFKLWGSSVLTDTVPPDDEQVLINLGFLSKSKSSDVIVGVVKSEAALTPVELDSWIMKPSSGFFALSLSFGTTTLNL